jgi:hypothetical protein
VTTTVPQDETGTPEYRQFIGGDWVETSSGRSFGEQARSTTMRLVPRSAGT